MNGDLTYHAVTVTCHTVGCSNGATPITVDVPDDPPEPSVTCGVCSQPITDIRGA
jgi:hypothetical protein